MVSTRSVAVVPAGCSPVSRKPTTGGSSMDSGWPHIAAPAAAPAQPPEPVDHGGVGVGADQGVAIRPAVVRGKDHPRQVLEVDLVADPGARRHHPEPVERLLGPSKELI